MDDKIFDRIHEVDLKSTMETSYIDYASRYKEEFFIQWLN